VVFTFSKPPGVLATSLAGPASGVAGFRFGRSARVGGAMAALLVVYGSWQLLGWGPAGDRHLIGDAFFYPVGVAAAWTAWRASQRVATWPRLQRAWRFLALGALVYLAGDVAQTVYELAGDKPYPSIADVFYLSFYPLLLFGLLSFSVVGG